ncbi:MAG: ABC transporter permease [Muribaculaceae bacterium]|nr:ABC transporter permease [Muribaculaceae bacterium]
MLPSLRRGIATLATRRIYIVMMIVVPMVFTFFFTDLMHRGLPQKVPVGIVDMDRSALSRRVVRQLNAEQLIDITTDADSYADAIARVRRGSIYGFFYIPADFQRRTLAGEKPTLTFYSNMSVFVPGSLSYKGFKTIAVTTAGQVVATTLQSAGLDPGSAEALLQPLGQDIHPIGNPWLNYSIYLSQSFIPAMMALLVMLVTAFSITVEIKQNTSPEWLATARGNIIVALTGKLLPQTIIFSIVGIAAQSVLFGYLHFPLHCHPARIILAMILLVIASQAFALIVVEWLPNMRLSMSVLSLIGILTFSVAGFSFPVEKMYGAIGIFAHILPVRYYFLIYIDQALNGIPLYYSRLYYAALCVFPVLPLLGLPRLRRRLARPVYVP